MSYSLEVLEILKLLRDVLPIFQLPLPRSTASAGAQALKISENNNTDLYSKLDIEARMIGLCLTSDIRLPPESSSKFSKALAVTCTVFEDLVCGELVQTVPVLPSTTVVFPKLLIIQSLVMNSPSTGSLYNPGRFYAEGIVRFSNDDQTNDKLMKRLNRCSDILSRLFLESSLYSDSDTVQPDDHFMSVFKTTIPLILRESTRSLYHALRDKEQHCLLMGNRGAHSASININLFQSSSIPDDSKEFSLMFSAHSELRSWQEGRVYVMENRGKVTIAETTRDITQFAKREKVRNICEYFENYRQKRLRSYLFVENDVLYKVRPIDFRHAQSNNHYFESVPISLETLLSKSELGGFEKKLLEIIITRIFLEVCEGPWLRQKWGKESFHFFPEACNKKIDLNKPYITADLEYDSDEGNPDSFDMSHSHPSILALGILLLEIEMGLPIESQWQKEDLIGGKLPNVNTNHTTAKTLLNSKKWKRRICQPSRNAIQACLECGFLRPDSTFLDEEWTQNIYKSVVEPLQHELFACFPDQLAEILGGSFLNIQEDSLPARARSENMEICATNSTSNHSDFSPPQPEFVCASVSIEVPRTHTQTFMLFDDILTRNPEKENLSKQWFSRFEKFVESHLDLDNLIKANPSYKRVRIAVLDTGINEKHPVLYQNSERIVETRNWIEDGNGMMDMYETGHGTHTAALVLQTAPYAQICVARISKGKSLGRAEHIRDAIEWAVNDCDADIISMSFGLSVENPIIQTAIDDAFRKGRILFAATANDGGNSGVAYPAKDPIVIGVNSSDGKGNRSVFSPTARSNEDNFCVVGEAIESFWHDSNGVWPTAVVKSGTSYAAPIAAGLAGSLLDYARLKMNLNEDSLKSLRRYKGMRAVFHLMKDNEPRDGYDFVAPWWLWEHGKSINLVHLQIEEALRKA